jgi:hypothetical protein
MKKLLPMGLLLILTLSACSSADQRSEEEQNLNVAKQTNLSMTYDAEGFTFNYPENWTISEDGDHYLYDSDSDSWRMQIYDTDVMGGRCSVEEKNEVFIDSNGRSWSLSIQKDGVPEGLEDMCAEYLNSQSNIRTAETTVTNDNGEYLSILFYQYDLNEEEGALAEFEDILNSVVLK